MGLGEISAPGFGVISCFASPLRRPIYVVQPFPAPWAW